MELRLLRSFVAVAEELHFGRAARRLHLSQPPLSLQIKKLEDDLGVRLLERTRRAVALTPAGQDLLGRARYILGEAARAAASAQQIARGQRGVLTIGYAAAATHALLPYAAPRWRAAHPDVRLELVELRSANQPDALRERRIDVGIVCAPIDAHDLDEHVVVRERLVVAVPARHPLARRRALSPAALDGAPYVGVAPDIEPAWANAAMRALRAARCAPVLVQECDTKIAMLGLVAAGLGVSVVSESMMTLRRRGVVFRPLRGVPLRLPLAALAPRALEPAAAAFVEIARSMPSAW